MENETIDKLTKLAQTFRKKIRTDEDHAFMAASINNADLDCMALSHIWVDWGCRYQPDKNPLFEALAWKSAWRNFLNEIKNNFNLIKFKGEETPGFKRTKDNYNETDKETRDIFPPPLPDLTYEEKETHRNFEKALSEIELIKKNGRVSKRESKVIIRRQQLMNWGFGNKAPNEEEIEERIFFLHKVLNDMAPETASTKAGLLSVLIRREVLLKHGSAMLRDDWVIELAAINGYK
jgi:hypothetical protein